MVPQFTRKCCYGASKKLVSTGRSPLSILARIASGSVASMRQMHFSPSRTRRGGTGAGSDHVRPVRARRPSVVSSPTVKVCGQLFGGAAAVLTAGTATSRSWRGTEPNARLWSGARIADASSCLHLAMRAVSAGVLTPLCASLRVVMGCR